MIQRPPSHGSMPLRDRTSTAKSRLCSRRRWIAEHRLFACPSLTKLWPLLFFVVLSCSVSCSGSGSASSSGNTDSSDVPRTDQIQPYAGSWQFRYGDSPRLADGSPTWARDTAESPDWSTTDRIHNPPGRTGHQDLWLRTRLVGPALPDTTLFLHEVDQCMEAFLDGKSIARFGPMEGDARRFIAKRPLFLPLGQQPQGQLLTLHFRSVYSDIGLLRSPLWGGQAELFADAMKRGLPFLVVGCTAFALSLGVLGLFLLQRRERLYLLYALQCFCIGSYLFSRSLSRAYIFDHPALWRLILVASFCLISATMCAFVAQLYSGGWSRFMRGLGLANAVLFCVGMLGTFSGVIHLELFLKASLLFWLPFAIAIAAVAVHGLLGRNADARILALGLIGTSILAIPQVLGALHFVSFSVDVRAMAGVVFIGSMGAILIRRYRAFVKRLADYSAALSMSLSASQHSGPQEHADNMLQALQRLLQAERAFLFQCDEAGDQLRMLAARGAKGPLADLPIDRAGCDLPTLDASLKRRRPAMRQRLRKEPTDPKGPQRSQSVMAAPLLVQGRLLGVVYLESSANRGEFQSDDLEILIELGNQVALTLSATRADDLEEQSIHTRKKLDAQRSLLTAATRLARGELHTRVHVDEQHELAPLARAVETMRRDLLAKLHDLQSTHAAEQQLNRDLRHQLERRLQRVVRHSVVSEVAREDSAPLRSDTGARARQTPVLAPDAPLGRNYRVVALLEERQGSRLYEVLRSADQQHFVAHVLSSAAHPALLARFAREAKILTVLHDPHLARVIDIDQAPDGAAFLISDLHKSQPLHQRRDLYGSPGIALRVIAQLAAGLHVLHRHGIVHRSLRPGAVRISSGPHTLQVQLIDLGLAAVVSPADAQLRELMAEAAAAAIQADEVLTSSEDEARQLLRYRAPELAAGLATATPPSDVYSLGLVAIELLINEAIPTLAAAHPPAKGGPVAVDLQAVEARLGQVAGLPVAIAKRLVQALHPDAAQRPSSEALRAALAAYLPDPATPGPIRRETV